jgi:hypothetical protein
MSLRKIFEEAYGGTEKTAEDIFDKLLGDEKDGEQTMKLAEAYDELGRGLARETFAAEVMGQEKTGAEDDLLSKILSDDDGEKTAEDDADGDDGDDDADGDDGEKVASDPVMEHILGIEKEAEAEADIEIEGAEEYQEKLASIDKEAAVAFKLIKEAAKGKKSAKKLWESIKALAGKKGKKGKKAKGFVGKAMAAVKGAPGATRKGLRKAYRATKRHPGVAAGAAAAGGTAGLAAGYAAGKKKK